MERLFLAEVVKVPVQPVLDDVADAKLDDLLVLRKLELARVI
ncbi:MAG: hypothetical protein UY18_C0047G0008, partial [Microgenomates group bacterium GW2011_GWF2_47_9]